MSFSPAAREFRLVRRLARPLTRYFVLGMLALVATNALDVLCPLTLKHAIDGLSEGKQRAVFQATAIYLGLTIATAGLRYTWRVLYGRFHHRFASDLREMLFHRLTQLGPSFYDKQSVGDLISLMSNDVNTVRMAVGPALLILVDGITLVAFIVPIMGSLSWTWTWRCLILFPLLPWVAGKLEGLIHAAGRLQQDRLAELSAHTQESISGIRTIKGMHQLDTRMRGFDQKSLQYSEASTAITHYDAVFEICMHLAVLLAGAILLAWGGDAVLTGALSLGAFVAFYQYLHQLLWPMSAIGSSLSLVQQGRASFQRIGRVLDHPIDVEDRGQLTIDRIHEIQFSDVSYTYPGTRHPAIRNFSTLFARGETVAIVGPVGAGKTTLLQLIARVRSIDCGKLLINGIPIDEISLTSLREHIAFVPQEAFLFAQPVSHNLSPMEEDAGDEMSIAARRAQIEPDILALPRKYREWIGERGTSLSGGQKQRLTLARALMRNADVLVLDDSLSAVDAKTEQQILEELKKWREDRPEAIVLIVTHRPGVLRQCDRVLRLEAPSVLPALRERGFPSAEVQPL